ncbi:MAG: acyl-CoA dehydratase activase, partial [Candidatus Kariarchaeaceae archaeon]
MTDEIFVGIDVGSSTAKSVVIDATGKILSYMVKKTGVNMKNIAQDVYEQSLESLNLSKPPNFIVSTGYGRKNVSFADTDITEITCTAKGAHFYFPKQATIVDIGGQDNKVIFIGENGIIREFKLNRKCAAGTGAFLEEICWRLDIPIEEMQSIARKSNT